MPRVEHAIDDLAVEIKFGSTDERPVAEVRGDEVDGLRRSGQRSNLGIVLDGA